MKQPLPPMYQFHIANFFRNLEWNFRNLHLEVDMKLCSYGYIEITLPIAEDFICLINIGEEIRLKFYKEMNGKRHYITIPFELGMEYLPSMLTDIVEMNEKGLYIYSHNPVLDILRTISFIKKNGGELLPVLRESYKTRSNKCNMKQLIINYQMLMRNSLKNETSVKEIPTSLNGRLVIEIPLKGRFVAFICVDETVTLTFNEVWTDNEGEKLMRKVRIDSVDLPESLWMIVNVIPYKLFEINLEKGTLDITEIVKIISDNKEKLYELCIHNSRTRTHKLNY